MKITIERLPQSRINCSAEISPEAHAKAEAQALGKFAEHVKVDGFRPGKAPADKVREKVDPDELLKESVHILLPDVLRGAIEEHKLSPIIPPKVQISKRFPLTLSVLFVESPQVKVGTVKMGKKTETTVEKKDVEDFISKLLQQDRTETPVERAIEKDDTVHLELEALDEKGNKINELSHKRFRAMIGSGESSIPELETALIGKKKDEKTGITITLPKEHPLEPLRGKKITFNATVQSVASTQTPALTPEYLKERLKVEKTPEQFKEDVQKMLTERRTLDGKQAREQEFLDKVREATKVELAPELVEAELQEIVDDLHGKLQRQGMTVDDWLKAIGKDAKQAVEEMRGIAQGRLTLRFGLKEMIKKEKIEVTDDELKSSIEEAIAHHKGHDHDASADYQPGKPGYDQLKWEKQVEKLMAVYLT